MAALTRVKQCVLVGHSLFIFIPEYYSMAQLTFRSSTEGSLGCFQAWAGVNKAAFDTRGHTLPNSFG